MEKFIYGTGERVVSTRKKGVELLSQPNFTHKSCMNFSDQIKPKYSKTMKDREEFYELAGERCVIIVISTHPRFERSKLIPYCTFV